ncbi:MAG: DNA repair protein RecO [Gemmatimonadota bacterium]|nr:DNA repair protein RecO [Gemmatimonadota bacterium]MDE2873374.1 DNA repair protein RecO [Gemmatimonadota bacterium]
MPAIATAAILLRTHPYSESSRVLRFYTRDLGLLSVMARGVRRAASRGRGAPGTFGEGMAVITVRDNRELQLLHEFTPTKARLGLAGDFRRLAGASVAAELVLRHAGQEPNAELFDSLAAGLDRLETGSPVGATGEVLALCWRMVQVLGFGPELGSCTACGRALEAGEMGRFDVAAGGLRGPECPAPAASRRIGPMARAQLSSLLAGEAPRGLLKPRAHLSLLDDFTTFHMLGGRRLGSFRFLDPPDDTQPEEPCGD